MSDHELQQQLVEQWEAAAQAAANPPDPSEPAEQFAEFFNQQLNNQEK